LFFFFEALAQFQATVLLSFFAQNSKYYNNFANKYLKKEERHKNWYLQPSFGNWVHLYKDLQKYTQNILKNKNKSDEIMELFGNPSQQFFEMITNKTITKITKDITFYRNSWKGHGGVISKQEQVERLEKLEKQLLKIQLHISDAYCQTLLVLPSTNKYKSGIYHYNVKKMVGTKYPFREIKINTDIAMEEDHLYLVHVGQLKPIELLPFVQLRGSPEEERNAIYFYNRIEGEKIRLISYHYEKQGEVRSMDETLLGIIHKYLIPDGIDE